jgi:hypothetical protein
MTRLTTMVAVTRLALRVVLPTIQIFDGLGFAQALDELADIRLRAGCAV